MTRSGVRSPSAPPDTLFKYLIYIGKERMPDRASPATFPNAFWKAPEFIGTTSRNALLRSAISPPPPCGHGFRFGADPPLSFLGRVAGAVVVSLPWQVVDPPRVGDVALALAPRWPCLRCTLRRRMPVSFGWDRFALPDTAARLGRFCLGLHGVERIPATGTGRPKFDRLGVHVFASRIANGDHPAIAVMVAGLTDQLPAGQEARQPFARRICQVVDPARPCPRARIWT